MVDVCGVHSWQGVEVWFEIMACECFMLLSCSSLILSHWKNSKYCFFPVRYIRGLPFGSLVDSGVDTRSVQHAVQGTWSSNSLFTPLSSSPIDWKWSSQCQTGSPNRNHTNLNWGTPYRSSQWAAFGNLIRIGGFEVVCMLVQQASLESIGNYNYTKALICHQYWLEKTRLTVHFRLAIICCYGLCHCFVQLHMRLI